MSNEVAKKYQRYLGAYESDVKVGDKFIHCFLILLEDADGNQSMSPVYVQPNQVESTSKTFQRLRPILYAPDDPDAVLKDEKTVEMTELVRHEVIPEEQQRH